MSVRSLLAAGWMLSASWAYGQYLDPSDRDQTLKLYTVFESVREPTGEDAWTKTVAAVEAARAATARSPADAEALAVLAEAYNVHLATGLRNLRHSIFFTTESFQGLHLSFVSVDVNARAGRRSTTMSAGDRSITGKELPRPLERRVPDTIRQIALGHAELALSQIEEGRRRLETIEAIRVSSSVAAALDAMRAAMERSSAAARGWIAFEGDDGPYAAAIDAFQRYLDAANAAAAPVPEVRSEAIGVINRANRAIARLELEVAAEMAGGRFLHVEIDALGPL